MKKAISMKCTQEQFDAIKEKLVGCEIESITNFEADSYLVNNYLGQENVITDLDTGRKSANNRQVQEVFNEQVFLEACGIEIERAFKGIELQYWSEHFDKWLDCNILTKFRFKPDYSKEIAELEKQIQTLKNK